MSDREERLAAENEMRAADYLRLCKEFDQLTAERDALKAEAIDAEYHRGRLAAQIKELSAQLEDSQAHVMCGLDVAVLSAQLTELREAVEAVRDGAELELDVSDSIAYVDNEALKSLLALLAKLPPR